MTRCVTQKRNSACFILLEIDLPKQTPCPANESFGCSPVSNWCAIDCITRSVKGEKGRSPAASVFPCLGVGDKLQSCVLILTTLTSLSVPALKHIAGNFALTFLPLLERFILLHPLYFRFDYLPLSFSPNLITGQRATGHAVFVSWKATTPSDHWIFKTFLAMTLPSFVGGYQHFGGNCCLHLSTRRNYNISHKKW